ncbi:hypothetical protein MR730_09205 [bacterium]|nr:hypothetical protein [bacterium]
MAEKQKYTVHQTQFELSPASNEQGFCFTHYNAPSDRACIGHLRGDFGETGTTFHHTWWPHNAHLITPSFNTELKDVITGLRQNGLLKDRKTMLARSMRFRTAIIPTEGRNTMAFRIETPEHLFYLRCIPNKGEYNFYCYGYNKTMLMEVLRQQKKLPRIAWAELDSSHEVVAICYGESGYHKWEPEGYIAMTSTEIVDDLNQKAGVSKAQASAMKAGSLFGWHCPAADPQNYDELGRPTYHKKEAVRQQEVR